ncbi:P-loop containing nucleoside triphosphate hydrolase protein [Phaeosphaeria sp. MPI-PUGE-AT-0046c]|nr:P-loop containing nucleoside triphosphate hydrolase protein [Phaeosphaeria sp. MPI-PUGE-AT-0046c]
MYNIVVFGEARVGKTIFMDSLLRDLHMYPFSGTVPGIQHRLTVDGVPVEANFLDLSSTTIRTADASFQPDLFVNSLAQADGIVLMYDITSLESFEHITTQGYMYACMCSQYMSGCVRPVGCEYILVGNKEDLRVSHDKPGVDTEVAREWAQSQGMHHVELSSWGTGAPEAAVRELIGSIQRTEQRAAKDAQEQEAMKQRSRNAFKSKIKLAFGRTKSDA